MISGQAFERLHKAAAAGGWAAVAAVAAAVLSRPSSGQGVAAGCARGLLSGGAAALSAFAGAVAAGGRARDAWRSSQLRHVLLCFAPPPSSVLCLTEGAWHMATKYTAACATNKRLHDAHGQRWHGLSRNSNWCRAINPLFHVVLVSGLY